MCNNATIYNGPDTIYYKAAKKLMAGGTKIMKKVRVFSWIIRCTLFQYEVYILLLLKVIIPAWLSNFLAILRIVPSDFWLNQRWHVNKRCVKISGVASIGARWAECPLDSKKIVKNWEKSGKRGEKSGKRGENQEKEEKEGRKGQNREGFFTLPSWQIGLATLLVKIPWNRVQGKVNYHLLCQCLERKRRVDYSSSRSILKNGTQSNTEA